MGLAAVMLLTSRVSFARFLNFAQADTCTLQRMAKLELEMVDFNLDAFYIFCHPGEEDRNVDPSVSHSRSIGCPGSRNDNGGGFCRTSRDSAPCEMRTLEKSWSSPAHPPGD